MSTTPDVEKLILEASERIHIQAPDLSQGEIVKLLGKFIKEPTIGRTLPGNIGQKISSITADNLRNFSNGQKWQKLLTEFKASPRIRALYGIITEEGDVGKFSSYYKTLSSTFPLDNPSVRTTVVPYLLTLLDKSSNSSFEQAFQQLKIDASLRPSDLSESFKLGNAIEERLIASGGTLTRDQILSFLSTAPPQYSIDQIITVLGNTPDDRIRIKAKYTSFTPAQQAELSQIITERASYLNISRQDFIPFLEYTVKKYPFATFESLITTVRNPYLVKFATFSPQQRIILNQALESSPTLRFSGKVTKNFINKYLLQHPDIGYDELLSVIQNLTNGQLRSTIFY